MDGIVHTLGVERQFKKIKHLKMMTNLAPCTSRQYAVGDSGRRFNSLESLIATNYPSIWTEKIYYPDYKAAEGSKSQAFTEVDIYNLDSADTDYLCDVLISFGYANHFREFAFQVKERSGYLDDLLGWAEKWNEIRNAKQPVDDDAFINSIYYVCSNTDAEGLSRAVQCIPKEICDESGDKMSFLGWGFFESLGTGDYRWVDVLLVDGAWSRSGVGVATNRDWIAAPQEIEFTPKYR
jgi:hypothetical protein